MNNKEYLSREELERYLSSDMNEKEMHDVEMKAEEDSFNNSAFEGYNSNPGAFADLDSLRKKYSSANSGRSFTFKGYSRIIISSAAILTVVFMSYYFINLISEEATPVISEVIKTPAIENPINTDDGISEKISPEPITIMPDNKEIEEDVKEDEKNLSSSPVLNISETLSQNNIVQTSDDLKIKGIQDDSSIEQESQDIIKDENTVSLTIPVESNIINPAIISEVNGSYNFTSTSANYASPPVNTVNVKYVIEDSFDYEVANNVTITYLYDLKIIDYTTVYESEIKKNLNVAQGGLDAKFENKRSLQSKSVVASEDVIEYITYADFLEDCIMHYKSGRYESAIDNFKIILREHPDELNAWFYSGLSYFHTGDYLMALENLDYVINHPINEFDQEAEWYKALVLIKLNSLSNARELLNKIITDSLFYHDKAVEKLNELEK